MEAEDDGKEKESTPKKAATKRSRKGDEDDKSEEDEEEAEAKSDEDNDTGALLDDLSQRTSVPGTPRFEPSQQPSQEVKSYET